MKRIISNAWNLIAIAVVAYLGFDFLRDIGNPWSIAAVVAALALLPFVFGPILTHQTHRITLKPNMIQFDPEGPGSPLELRSHFDATADWLDQLGFATERYYQLKHASPNADGWVLLFRNAKTGETARVITAVSTSDIIRIGTSFVVFIAEFSDGTQVVTSNRRSALIYPRRNPPYYGRAFPQISDVRQLYVVHRARVENLAAGLIAVDPVGDDPYGYIRRVDFETTFAHAAACGYTYNDEMEGVLRMTWKGAILATWKLLPPIKQIRLGWERLMATRQLGNLKAGRPVT